MIAAAWLLAALAPIVIPDGVADPGATTAVFARAPGIEAVDLRTGKPLWHSAAADAPLIVHGNTLYARARDPNAPNRLRVLAFDLRKGTLRATSPPVELPAFVDVRAAPSASGCHPFFVTWPRIHEDRLVLAWSASSGWMSGVPPPPGAVKGDRGLIRFDAALTTFDMAPWDDAAVMIAAPAAPPIRFAVEPRGAQQAVVLHPDGQPERVLVEQQTITQAYRTPDGRLIVVVAGGWSVLFAADDGRFVARLPHNVGTIAVVGRSLIVADTARPTSVLRGCTPRTLRVVETSKGRALWTRPLPPRDSTPLSFVLAPRVSLA